MSPERSRLAPRSRWESVWKKRERRSVPAHNPVRRHKHPNGGPFAYCVCGQAIVHLAGVWWHLYRKVR